MRMLMRTGVLACTLLYILSLSSCKLLEQYFDRATVESPKSVERTEIHRTDHVGLTEADLLGAMVLVEGGTFMMGDEYADLWEACRPVHEVTLTYDYQIAAYAVTFNDYDQFCESTGKAKPSDEGWGRGQRPVINVSWWDAISYCNWLSEREGIPVAYRLLGEPNEGHMIDASENVTTDITKVLGYRLPTEAEWEYAARGGNNHLPYKYSGSDNPDRVAWYVENSGRKTQPVGQLAPNALGIYDMSGNILEWCVDWFDSYSIGAKMNPLGGVSGLYRVVRGGAWNTHLNVVRLAFRTNGSPESLNNVIGFRIAKTAP